VHQGVVEHYLGPSKNLVTANGNQTRLTGTGSNQVNFALHARQLRAHLSSLSRSSFRKRVAARASLQKIQRGAPQASPPAKTYGSWQEQITIRQREHDPHNKPARPAPAALGLAGDATRSSQPKTKGDLKKLDSSVMDSPRQGL
jgi:hypothetical protein